MKHMEWQRSYSSTRNLSTASTQTTTAACEASWELPNAQKERLGRGSDIEVALKWNKQINKNWRNISSLLEKLRTFASSEVLSRLPGNVSTSRPLTEIEASHLSQKNETTLTEAVAFALSDEPQSTNTVTGLRHVGGEPELTEWDAQLPQRPLLSVFWHRAAQRTDGEER